MLEPVRRKWHTGLGAKYAVEQQEKATTEHMKSTILVDVVLHGSASL
jgi:hypothetical protein